MSAPALTDGQSWYVAFTHPNAEARAVMHLRNQGYATYFPRILKKRKFGRRIERAPAPLFPRYVFVGLDIHYQRWRSVNGTVGVSHLVCHGDRPASVDECVIKSIASREKEGLVQLTPTRFDIGQAVRIVDGVFADQLGLYEGLGERDRVRILLDLLGRKVKVMIENDSVVAA
ncbi:MAG: transcription termination/antitermination NusG family protein [Pseudorhodoplanes sp.]|jgi:transcriptional antiterminator RfaH|nr:transcription termination/antitermination NusG family protein [Pseudorhodoplanes sp.]